MPADANLPVAIFTHRTPEWKPFSSIRRSKKNKHLVEFNPAFPLVAECYTLFIDHHLTPHTHDYLEIACVCSGSGFCEIRDQRIQMRPGDLVLVGDTDFHTFWSDYRDPLRIVVLYFMPELISRGSYDFLNYNYIAVFRAPDHPPLIPAEMVNRMLPQRIERLYWMLHADPQSPLAAKTELYEILLTIASVTTGAMSCTTSSRGSLTRPRQAGGSRGSRGTADTRRMEAVIGFLHGRIDSEIRVADCAEIAGLSRYAFCRFFLRTTGDTLVEYVNKMRIDRARELLVETELPVSHIALDVGYRTISYFNRVFHSLVGMTPTEFRRRVQLVRDAAP